MTRLRRTYVIIIRDANYVHGIQIRMYENHMVHHAELRISRLITSVRPKNPHNYLFLAVYMPRCCTASQ